MLTPEIDKARIRYINERPKYEAAAQHMADEVRHGAYRKRIDCTVSYRAKEVHSFVKKGLTDKRAKDPYDGIYDKAGVRIVVGQLLDVDRSIELLHELFGAHTHYVDDRVDIPPENRFDYFSVHYHMKVPEAIVSSVKSDERMTCEFQIATEASNLWSRMSHPLLYKPELPVPKSVRRSLYRLVALVELFDSEVQQAVTSMRSHPDRELNHLIAQLERIFLAFCGVEHNQVLTRKIAGLILETLKGEARERYRDTLSDFATLYRADLEAIYRKYGPHSESGQVGNHLLASQPESIAIFERLENAPRALSKIWNRNGASEDLLEQMKDIWAA